MDDLINLIDSYTDKCNYLSGFYIELGIMDKDSYKTITISSDNAGSKITVFDLLYFVEFGTLVLPARRILEHLVFQLQSLFDEKLSKITDTIWEENWSKSNIDFEMRQFELQLNQKIPELIRSFSYNTSYIENTAGAALSDNQIISTKSLINYIKCRIYRK